MRKCAVSIESVPVGKANFERRRAVGASGSEIARISAEQVKSGAERRSTSALPVRRPQGKRGSVGETGKRRDLARGCFAARFAFSLSLPLPHSLHPAVLSPSAEQCGVRCERELWRCRIELLERRAVLRQPALARLPREPLLRQRRDDIPLLPRLALALAHGGRVRCVGSEARRKEETAAKKRGRKEGRRKERKKERQKEERVWRGECRGKERAMHSERKDERDTEIRSE